MWLLNACVVILIGCDMTYEVRFNDEESCEIARRVFMDGETLNERNSTAYCWPED